MATSLSGWYWWLGLASCLAIGGAMPLGDCALAQIVPDATLGTQRSVVTPNGRVDVISGGATRGANLFHSFEQFSVFTGHTAYFNNADSIRNIISRVTGGSVSNIDGLLKANASANLFLLNPNGIIFGPNASVNIGGSFLASTASAVNFADGSFFGATAHSTTPLLRVSVPIGLQYGGTAGSILNQSRATNSSGQRVGLQVQAGRTLALVGGDVRLDGGRLEAPGGRVELGGVAGAGTVRLNVDSNNLLVSFPDGVARADVYLTNRGSNTARVNVAASNGGSIAITARNIDISGRSSLLGGLETGLGFPGASAGDIMLNGTSVIDVTNSSNIANDVRSGAVGKGGNINITARSLSFTNGARLSASTLGQGDAGRVTIRATDTVSFDGVGSNGESSRATSNVGESAVGNGGGIDITARSISFTNGARLGASTLGQGDAARVTIRATDTVSFDGVGSNGESSRATSRVGKGAVGNGGGIDITARSLSFTNGSFLSASTFGRGDAGRVTIRATDTVSFDGVGSNGESSQTSSIVGKSAMGNGGGIDITARSLFFTNGSFLSASTFGQGDAGRVNINARDTVSFDGVGSNGFSSGAFSNGGESAMGNGGGINITTGSLSVTNGGGLTASIKGSGAAGDIEVAARSIRLSDRAFLSSDTTGGQGNIILNSQDLVLRRGSKITTNAAGTVTGGNIVIDTGVLAALDNSNISASAVTGRGGNIQINTQGIFRSPDSNITASSQLGINGTVRINTPDVDPSRGLVVLPAQVVDRSGLIAQGCNAQSGTTGSQFTLTGRGGLPPSPYDALTSAPFWEDARLPIATMNQQRSALPLPLERSHPPHATPPSGTTAAPIVPATGWVFNNLGLVTLTALAPNAPVSLGSNRLPCHAPQQ